MRRLQLYPELPQAAVARVAARQHDSDCKLCSARTDRTRTVCFRGEGTPGGLLFIGETPTRTEDQIGRPFTDGVGRYIRGLLAAAWKGPIALDYAVRCTAGRDIDEEWIDACRGYMRTMIQQVQPKRIIAMGNAAVLSVLGQRPPLIYARRGFGWYFNELDEAIPVFLLTPAANALRNRFDKAQFESDLAWAVNADVEEPDWSAATWLVENADDARRAVDDALSWDSGFTYDVETSGRMANRDFLIESLTVAPTFDDWNAYTWTREALRDAGACAELRRLLESRQGIDTQNGKYDDRSVASYKPIGADVRGTRYDTRLMRKLREPASAASLDVLGWLVGLGGHKAEATRATDSICKELRRLATPKHTLTPTGKVRKIAPPAFHAKEGHLQQIAAGQDAEAFMFHYVEPSLLYRYNARDVLVTRRTAQMLEPLVRSDARTDRVWRELTQPASVAVRYMEQWGIPCDRDAVQNLSAYCKAKIADAQSRIDKYKPGLNPNSPKQVAEYLYDELGLKCTKETKSGGRSTDADALEALAGKHPVIQALIDKRKYVKMDGTYAEGMLPHIQEDGRIHPSILIDGTGTGRYSCADPNLQNLPRAEADEHNPDAAMVRNCFVSLPGWLLLELDYSQIELRVMAILSGDPVMAADFESGVDIHMNNATLSCEAAFKIPRATWDKMTKEQRKPYRSKIKSATFAKPYGKKPRTLAKEWGVPVAEAEAIDRAIWGRYKVFDKWAQDQISRVRKLGYVETWWDGAPAMRRPLHEIGSSEDGIRVHAENAAINTPVQGTAAHFMSASIPRVVRMIHNEYRGRAEAVLTVHDSLVLHVREKLLSELAHRTREIMLSHNSAGVRIDVEAKYGTAYGSLQDFKFAA